MAAEFYGVKFALPSQTKYWVYISNDLHVLGNLWSVNAIFVVKFKNRSDRDVILTATLPFICFSGQVKLVSLQRATLQENGSCKSPKHCANHVSNLSEKLFSVMLGFTRACAIMLYSSQNIRFLLPKWLPDWKIEDIFLRTVLGNAEVWKQTPK